MVVSLDAANDLLRVAFIRFNNSIGVDSLQVEYGGVDVSGLFLFADLPIQIFQPSALW
jgi:hypothetical protein